MVLGDALDIILAHQLEVLANSSEEQLLEVADRIVHPLIAKAKKVRKLLQLHRLIGEHEVVRQLGALLGFLH